MPIAVVQEFAEIGKKITGYRLKIEDPYQRAGSCMEIANKFGTAIGRVIGRK